ncbi:hypothetical protein F5Y16DRAFT_412473 [Xylariaceae sp. FL0255]|nr:hypothetical protein F5Y16DRAFT_412473 [Xylariaceae sp. FL0255]
MAQRQPSRTPEPRNEDDAVTLNEETSGYTPLPMIRDRNTLGWENLQANKLTFNSRVTNNKVNTVFEAWEMISVRPTTEMTNKKLVCGVEVSKMYRQLKDGYTGVRAVPSYTQHELMHMVTAAEQNWDDNRRSSILSRLIPGKKRGSYAQNLSRRLFELPGPLPGKLGALLDCRIVATNKNPYVKREWSVVLLEQMNGVMTEEQVSSAFHDRITTKFSKVDAHEDPIQKWFVVLCGQESRVCTSGTGFAAFDTASNPWLRVDEKMIRDREAACEDEGFET